jgi:hypothetical protein
VSAAKEPASAGALHIANRNANMELSPLVLKPFSFRSEERIMKYRLFALVAAAILLAVPAAACTGYIDLSGYVYVWTNAPPGATSQVTYVKTPPVGQEVKPLKDAKVVFDDKDRSHPFTMETNADGYFHLGTTFELDEYVTIDISADGYLDAHGKLDVIEDTAFYYFVVMLVPS